MKTLFIDTHLWDIRIVLFENGIVVDKCEVINKKNNSEYIFPSLIKVIDGVKLDNIIVCVGPGSFTGVRLGVTIAKTLAYTLKIPIYTVSSLECLMISQENKKVAIGDENGFYVGVFNDDYTLEREYEYVDNEEFNNMNRTNCYCTSNNLNYENIYEYVFKYKGCVNPHIVKPIYVKKIGVEK